MKTRTLSLLAATFFAATSLLPAQTRTIGYGRTVVQLSAPFLQQFASLGAVITDLSSQPLVNGTSTFRVTEGAIDLQTAAGEVEHSGGYLVVAGGTTIRIQNLTLDSSNPQAPVLTALFVVNDKFVGRIALFNLQVPAGLTLPLQPVAGVEQINGFTLFLAPAAATEINAIFGGPAVQAGTNLGTANVYTVLEP